MKKVQFTSQNKWWTIARLSLGQRDRHKNDLLQEKENLKKGTFAICKKINTTANHWGRNRWNSDGFGLNMQTFKFDCCLLMVLPWNWFHSANDLFWIVTCKTLKYMCAFKSRLSPKWPSRLIQTNGVRPVFLVFESSHRFFNKRDFAKNLLKFCLKMFLLVDGDPQEWRRLFYTKGTDSI